MEEGRKEEASPDCLHFRKMCAELMDNVCEDGGAPGAALVSGVMETRGVWEPTTGGCPNWMTLQESRAGALSSPFFSLLQTHLPW